MVIVFLRSLIFQIAFFINCLLCFTFAILLLPFPSFVMMWFSRIWARSSLFLHRVITGARVEFRGVERIPQGALLVAAKHYSAWETMALLIFFPQATYILKRELLNVPLFGWHLRRAGQIAIDRSQGSQALAMMLKHTREAVDNGRQILIFPEGTRRKVGAPPDYKYGIVRLYQTLDVACMPIAMTSGLAWPRNTFLHYPRPIILEFLEPIPAGLDKDEFSQRVQTTIEENTNRLLVEAGFERKDEV